jgi:drug/metabolite transporter (DMT)-like permease
VVLCGGVGVAISEATASGNSLGVGICLLSVLAAAAMLDSTARTLAGRVDSVQLAFFTAPVTCACLVPPLLALEAAPFARHAAAAPAASAAILLAGGAFALAYNVVHNELVAITDAVTTCVLGQLKIVMLMVLSAAVLGEGRDFTARMSLGCACAILGFGMYSWAKIQQQAQQQQAAAARKRGGTARTPARGGARAARGSDTETPPRTLAAPATPSGARTALRTPSMRLRTPATTRRTPGRMV